MTGGLSAAEPIRPQEIDDARLRLADLDVFDSMAFNEADALDADGHIPIKVEVSERKPRYFGLGGTYSNTEGLGLEGYWGHRNLFGHAEKLRIEGGSISGSPNLGSIPI